jgi:hypothetical protein
MEMLNLEDRINKFETLMGKLLPTEFIEWLYTTDFFIAPASVNHHGNYEGGLFDHCFSVAETLKQLTKSNRLKWMNLRSPLIVGMFHDICKIDNYIKVIDKPGVEVFGGEVKDRTYKYDYNKDLLLSGHGDKSVMYLAQHMKLTPEEVLCIRWHMGAFDEKENWKFFLKRLINILMFFGHIPLI